MSQDLVSYQQLTNSQNIINFLFGLAWRSLFMQPYILQSQNFRLFSLYIMKYCFSFNCATWRCCLVNTLDRDSLSCSKVQSFCFYLVLAIITKICWALPFSMEMSEKPITKTASTSGRVNSSQMLSGYYFPSPLPPCSPSLPLLTQSFKKLLT